MAKILVTAAKDEVFDDFFPASVQQRLAALGEVTYNPFSRKLTKEELLDAVAGQEIVITHWSSPKLDHEVLCSADRLRLVAHGAGTLTPVITEELFDRDIPAITANSIMARYVAESTLGYIICALRQVPQNSALVKAGGWKNHRIAREQHSLLHGSVGLIGLGAIGRFLLELLRPFGCQVCVYDPYLTPQALSRWEFARLCTLEQTLHNPVVSLHAAKTPETFHMMNAATFAQIPDGGVFINTARGSLVDEAALANELAQGRLRAVIDVYDREPPVNSPLLSCRHSDGSPCDNLILSPHLAGFGANEQMTLALIDDIERFLRGEPLQLAVSRAQFRLMTQQ